MRPSDDPHSRHWRDEGRRWLHATAIFTRACCTAFITGVKRLEAHRQRFIEGADTPEPPDIEHPERKARKRRPRRRTPSHK